ANITSEPHAAAKDPAPVAQPPDSPQPNPREEFLKSIKLPDGFDGPPSAATKDPAPVVRPLEAVRPRAIRFPSNAENPPKRTGWIIQVGAFTSEAKAKQLLADLQSKASDLLAGTNPFTDTNQINDVTYYRARFGGLDKDRADSACKTLKRDYSVECVTIKN